MSRRTDGVLGAVAFAVFAGALVASDGAVSPAFAALGVAGTVAFEVVAFRNSATVRFYWERPIVQFATLSFAIVLAGVGWWLAPSSVLSAGIGAVGTYLVVLAGVLLEEFRSDSGSQPDR